MAKSKFFRIAVEGATVDGRTIERDWIDQMAAAYNPTTYTARINCEHIAGFSPQPPFNAYGSVIALKAENFDMQLDGKTVTKRALYAQIDANDQLLEINKKGQKLFSSCEIAPNFAGTGKAGLVGLAVTDNPASLGTEMLEFAAKAKVNPLAARKQDSANHFSEATELELTLEEGEQDTSGASGLIAAATAFFKNFGKQPEPQGGADQQQPPAPPAPPQNNSQQPPANDNFGALQALLGEGFTKLTAAIGGVQAETNAAITQLRQEHEALRNAVETTDGSQQRRPTATGGPNFAKTDC